MFCCRLLRLQAPSVHGPFLFLLSPTFLAKRYQLCTSPSFSLREQNEICIIVWDLIGLFHLHNLFWVYNLELTAKLGITWQMCVTIFSIDVQSVKHLLKAVVGSGLVAGREGEKAAMLYLLPAFHLSPKNPPPSRSYGYLNILWVETFTYFNFWIVVTFCYKE